MPKSPAPFVFVSGPDEYLVGRAAAELWGEMKEGLDADFSVEVVDAQVGKVDEVEQAVNRFRSAVQTVGLFGGRRVVWLKGVSFLGDNVLGRAESTEALCQDLKEALESVNPEEVGVLISACPVDRRRKFAKWLEQAGDFKLVGGDGKGGAGKGLAQALAEECRRLQVSIGPDAAQLLIGKVGGNSRLMLEEARKLATYLGEEGSEITSKLVEELTPNFGDGDFFETTEAFFSRDLEWTLEALRRHFFAGNDARPVISTLQGRNRLLAQIRALVDGGELRAGSVSAPALEAAGARYADCYGGLSGKSNLNVFTQNAWYLGKMAGGNLPSLKALLDHQLEFARAFEEIVARPNEQEEVLRSMAIRCLA